MYLTHVDSPVGELLLASDGECLCGLWLEGQKYYAAGVKDGECRDDLPVFVAARAWLSDYFAGMKPDPAVLPLAPMGTSYQREVWALLREIPYGRVVTYGQLAKGYEEKTGRKSCPRAVGSAVGRNPISILVPCHRVVGAGGSLTGYAGGVENKRFLLELERG